MPFIECYFAARRLTRIGTEYCEADGTSDASRSTKKLVHKVLKQST
jgi:hypothetical protein